MTQQTVVHEAVRQETAVEGELRQLVCFRLGDEDFGVDIHNVQEINRMVDITKIPQSLNYVEGVINLRGKIIPVIDLRMRFGFQTLKEKTKETRIVVLETRAVTVGIIVDQVTEVLRIPGGSIEPTPEIVSSDVDVRYIEGVAMLKENLLIVLNSEKLFTEDETKSFENIATA